MLPSSPHQKHNHPIFHGAVGQPKVCSALYELAPFSHLEKVVVWTKSGYFFLLVGQRGAVKWINAIISSSAR